MILVTPAYPRVARLFRHDQHQQTVRPASAGAAAAGCYFGLNQHTVYKILLLLSVAFAGYTVCVYRISDKVGSAPAQGAQAHAGWRLWQEKNCQSCHQLYGLGGYMGPDLTNAAAKGPDYLRSFILHGTGRMPDFHLSEKETNQLVAFLSWVDQTGQSRIPDSAVHWTGTYILE